jgi:hypothetical protein
MNSCFPLPTGSLSLQACGELLVFTYRGVATAAVVQKSVRELTSMSLSGLAPVWRMDRAVWAEGPTLPKESMVRALPQFERWPAAFVATPESYGWWRAYARDQAARGMVRAAFTDYAQACEWVSARNRAALAQARYEETRAQSVGRSGRRSDVCDPRQVSRPTSGPYLAQVG